jgi:CBS domain-containing protein
MDRTIGALASRPVICVEADMPVIEALRLMSARRISCVVVLLDGEPVGILTERDVVFAANWVIGQPGLLIREVMSKPVLTAAAECTVTEAYWLFRENDVRHLVVLGAQMELLGIFTKTDLVRAFHGTIFAETPDVRPLMSSHVWRVTPQVSARHALSLMASHAISGVVVAEGPQPLGVFSERDAVRLVVGDLDLASLPVSAAMTTTIVTVPVTTSPSRALELMRNHDVRRLLVVDGEGSLAGVLTQTDLSRVFERREPVPGDRLVGASPAPGYPVVFN